MEEPRKVVSFRQAHTQKEKLSVASTLLKKVIIGIFILFLVLFIILGKDLLKQLGAPVIVLLAGLAVWFFAHNKTEVVNTQGEFQFYDDHLVIYKSCMPYSSKKTLEEYTTYYYDGIEYCYFSAANRMLVISGKGHILSFRYNADGSKNETPYQEKEVETALDRLWLPDESNDGIPGAIEAYSPIRIERKAGMG